VAFEAVVAFEANVNQWSAARPGNGSRRDRQLICRCPAPTWDGPGLAPRTTGGPRNHGNLDVLGKHLGDRHLKPVAELKPLLESEPV